MCSLIMINNLFINASLDDSLRKYVLFKETNNVSFLKSFLVYSIAKIQNRSYLP